MKYSITAYDKAENELKRRREAVMNEHEVHAQEIAGGITIWIDELFVLEEYRSKGLGRELFKYIEENGDKKLRRIRLEVELENGRAISLYKKMGFEPAPYDGMWKTIL